MGTFGLNQLSIMSEIEKLIQQHFNTIHLEVNLEEITKTFTNYSLTIFQINDVLKIVKDNLSFFETKFKLRILDLSNLINYTLTALYEDEKYWNGSKTRIEILNEYKLLINSIK